MAEWGTAPWRIDVPGGDGAPPARCDVVVVGAGLTGLSAAYHLARGGARVAVLEATRVGAGASGHTGALVLEGTAAGPLPGADDCLPFLTRLVAEAGIACDLRLPGCALLVHRREPGALRPLWPDGDTTLCVAERTAGGTVDVGALLTGLARAARAAGASLHERARMVGVDAGAVQLADGRVGAGTVVLAVNAWTPALVPLPVEVVPALTLALATPPLDERTLDAIGLADRLPFYTDDLPYLWGRTLVDGRLVLGAGLVFPDDRHVDTLALDDHAVAEPLARLESRVRGFHPAIAAAGIGARWGGPIAFRRDALTPIVARHPDLAHVIVAGAYAGHGVALAPRVGALIADAVLHGRSLPAWGGFGAAAALRSDPLYALPRGSMP